MGPVPSGVPFVPPMGPVPKSNPMGSILKAGLNGEELTESYEEFPELTNITTIGMDGFDVEERKLLTIGWYPKDVKQICYIGMGDMNISIQEVLKREIEYTLKGCFLLDQQTHFLLIRNRNLSPDYQFRRIMENLLSQTGLRMGISRMEQPVILTKENLHGNS